MQLKYICKLCNTECKNVISLNSHIQYNHKEYNTKKYYDEFYKKENEGFCKTCGNPTKFENFIKGYRNYCNNSCSHKTEHFRTSFNNSIQNKNEWIKNRINSIKTKSTNGIKISDNDLNKRHEKTIHRTVDYSVCNATAYGRQGHVAVTVDAPAESRGPYARARS